MTPIARRAASVLMVLTLSIGGGAIAGCVGPDDAAPDGRTAAPASPATPASPPLDGALAGADDCEDLARRYVEAERDELLRWVRAAREQRDEASLSVLDGTTPAVDDTTLVAAVTGLGCEEDFFVRLRVELEALLDDGGASPVTGTARPSRFRTGALPAPPAIPAVPVLAAPATAGAPPNEYHWHWGRTYLFSMLPKGELTPQRDAPADFDYTNFDLRSNTYRDEAGVDWTLYRPFASAYHQPAGATGSPNKKFVAVDSRGGSFEAVLMPDGATATTPASPPYTYRTGNWLTSGAQIGTYNYTDSGSCFTCFIAHYVQDMVWHSDQAGYAPVPEHRWLDPSRDWSTYVQRYLDQVNPIARGARIVRDETGRLYRADISADGTVVTGDPIDDDLAQLALDLAMAMGAEPQLVRIAGSPGSPDATRAAGLTGRWTGSYVCAQGLTRLQLTIEAVDDRRVRATFDFSAVPSNPDVPTGSFAMSGEVEDGRLVLRPGAWNSRPAGYVTVGLSAQVVSDTTGEVGAISGTVQGPSCTWFRISRD